MPLRERKLIIAHRGASFYEKENTLKSFKKAIELHADFIEMDIRKTKDNILIVFHNSKINSFRIKDLTYKSLQEKTNVPVPTLEETLKFIKGKIKLVIDLKEKGYEKEIIGILLKYLKEKDFITASSNLSSLKKIKSENRKIKTGFILKRINLKNVLDLLQIKFFPEKTIKKYKIDYLVPGDAFANRKFLKKATDLNISLIFWPINDRKKAENLLKEKTVKGTITDKPDLLN